MVLPRVFLNVGPAPQEQAAKGMVLALGHGLTALVDISGGFSFFLFGPARAGKRRQEQKGDRTKSKSKRLLLSVSLPQHYPLLQIPCGLPHHGLSVTPHTQDVVFTPYSHWMGKQSR